MNNFKVIVYQKYTPPDFLELQGMKNLLSKRMKSW